MLRENGSNKGSLVLVVGPENQSRREVVRRLIEDRYPTVICSGPPGCALAREGACALLDSADATVIMPSHSVRRDVLAPLSNCAAHANNVVFLCPSALETPAGARVIRIGDVAGVANTVGDLLADRTNKARHEGRAVADVTDIWL